jgi:hypothetical protein
LERQAPEGISNKANGYYFAEQTEGGELTGQLYLACPGGSALLIRRAGGTSREEALESLTALINHLPHPKLTAPVPKAEVFCYSIDGENFNGREISRDIAWAAAEAAADDSGRPAGPTTIYTARIVHPDTDRMAKIAVERALEHMGDELYEMAGEHAEGQPKVSTQCGRALEAAFRAVLERPGVIKCYGVEAVEERPHSIPQEE